MMPQEIIDKQQAVQMHAQFGMLWGRPLLLDETVIAEVVEGDGYRLVGGPVKGGTVVDCGAHIGVFTSFCVALGARHVYAVEPEPANLEMLHLNVDKYPNVTVIKKALGGPERGTVRMAGASGGARKWTERDPAPWGQTSPEVEVITLDDLFIEYGLSDVAVLKLDMEGAEVDAILGAPDWTLGACNRIAMETHGRDICPWVEEPMVGRVVERLLWTHHVDVEGYPSKLGKLYATRYR